MINTLVSQPDARPLFVPARPALERPAVHEGRLPWVEPVKAVALIWIFLNHLVERAWGGAWLGNPAANWPGLGERLEQLKPMQASGILPLAANALRYLGWLGDAGVGVFLVVSGLGLTWACLGRDSDRPLDAMKFLRRRAGRIFPLWIAAHACFLLGPAIAGYRVSLADSQLYWSELGIRILPDQLYYGVAAWWYVTLLLQLYLVFPLLWHVMQRAGVGGLAVIATVALAVRAAGLFYFHDYLDAWSRGAIFITRLPEFVLGMMAAAWLRQSAGAARGATSRLALAGAGCILFAAGAAASVTLAGMTAAPLLESAGAFLSLYALFAGNRQARGAPPESSASDATRFQGLAGRFRLEKPHETQENHFSTPALDWIGRHSLSLFLVNQPLVNAMLPKVDATPRRVLIGVALAALASIIAALALEKFAHFAGTVLVNLRQRWGTRGLVMRLSGAVAVGWAGLIAGELWVRHVDPQEPPDIGWGERSSLMPSREFGWCMLPSRQTRLRWKSYDYEVTSNSLGFPGPQYPVEKPAGALRILVTGDAFTSAEGVDTNQSWPRLLETNLAAAMPGRQVQVTNFAITGYGPNQYAAVVKHFVPRYHPDLVVIGLFINDYGDALDTDDEFRESIGFGRADPEGLASILAFRQLASLCRVNVMATVSRLRHKPDQDGLLFGQFYFLHRDCPDLAGEGRRIVTTRLAEIQETAERNGARVLIVMIPSAPQVCGRAELPYWPNCLDVTDASVFDLDGPQRVTAEIAAALSIPCYDLRPALCRSVGACPYQPHNMHFTPLGHRIAADFVASVLLRDGHVK